MLDMKILCAEMDVVRKKLEHRGEDISGLILSPNWMSEDDNC